MRIDIWGPPRAAPSNGQAIGRAAAARRSLVRCRSQTRARAANQRAHVPCFATWCPLRGAAIVPRRVDPSTLPPSAGSDGNLGNGERVPGVVVVFSGGAPAARFFPLESGALVLGRREGSTGKLD